MRSETLDVPSIVGLGEACRLRQLEMAEDEKAIASKRDRLQNLLLDKIPGLVVNGDTTSRLTGNLHISIPDIPKSKFFIVFHYLLLNPAHHRKRPDRKILITNHNPNKDAAANKTLLNNDN